MGLALARVHRIAVSFPRSVLLEKGVCVCVRVIFFPSEYRSCEITSFLKYGPSSNPSESPPQLYTEVVGAGEFPSKSPRSKRKLLVNVLARGVTAR